MKIDDTLNFIYSAQPTSYIGSTYIILCTTADHQPYGNLFVVMSLVL